VDPKHHLIVAHEVTNVGSDRNQLTNMAKQARAAMDTEELTVIADRGYFKGEEILGCHKAGISPIVPKTVTSNATAAGRFGKDHFIYDAKINEYSCPAGQRLIWRYTGVEQGRNPHRYWSSSWGQCALKEKCTLSTERRVTRWEHEDVLDAMQTRLDLAPDSMRIRRQTVEQQYGTIKLWMGSAHFLMRTLKHVSTEMSLHVLAYNLKRVIKIMGIKGLLEAIRGYKPKPSEFF
jgi:transposase